MIKQEWRKQEKNYYAPSECPQVIEIPGFNYFCISGKGNPNHAFFAEYVGTLYTLSYAVKMDLKKKNIPGQPDYTVYPLEGVWQLENDTPLSPNGILNKDALIFNLMIRQPDTVSKEYAQEILKHVKKKKANPLWEQVKFEHLTDGLCVQALHIGSYDREAESFAQMEIFAAQQGRIRTGMDHREIYLSDARKTTPEKLRTILRFQVQ